MKTCTKCGETKSLDAFYKQRAECKLCRDEQARAYRLANPERMRSIRRRARTKRIDKELKSARERRARYTPEQKERYLNAERTRRDTLSDQYIRALLAMTTGVSRKAIPEHLIKLQRERLQIQRMLREFKKTMENVNGDPT